MEYPPFEALLFDSLVEADNRIRSLNVLGVIPGFSYSLDKWFIPMVKDIKSKLSEAEVNALVTIKDIKLDV